MASGGGICGVVDVERVCGVDCGEREDVDCGSVEFMVCWKCKCEKYLNGVIPSSDGPGRDI